jgi:hypothetical protein
MRGGFLRTAVAATAFSSIASAVAWAALPPSAQVAARQAAPRWLQIEVQAVTPPARGAAQGECVVDGRIARVFRGPGKAGDPVRAVVSCMGEGARVMPGPRVWWNLDALRAARLVEVFLDGERVVNDQGAILPAARTRPACAPDRPVCDLPDTAVTIETAAWLVGRWEGEGLGGRIDEAWSPAVAGQMVGHFRLSKDGKPVFHEFMVLEEHAGALRLRVKHFNPDMVGWEEKDGSVDFTFVSADAERIAFTSLVIQRQAADRMTMHLRMRRADGQVATEALHFRRVGG